MLVKPSRHVRPHQARPIHRKGCSYPGLRLQGHYRARLPVVGGASSFQASVQDFANNVNKNVSSFVEEQKLREKAQEAADSAQKTLKNAYEGAQDSARRMYIRIDSQYGLNEKARKAGQRMAEAAQEAEQAYGIRAHIRVWMQNMQRRIPMLQKRLAEFASTRPGKVAMVGLFVLSVYTGLIWNLLHIMLLMWWLLLPLSLVMVGVAQRVQEQRFREYQAESGSRSPMSSSSSRRYRQQSGPIIDAEWKPVDKK